MVVLCWPDGVLGVLTTKRAESDWERRFQVFFLLNSCAECEREPDGRGGGLGAVEMMVVVVELGKLS